MGNLRIRLYKPSGFCGETNANYLQNFLIYENR